MNDCNAKKELTQNESARIWQMKAWAIILVICAHCAGVALDAPVGSQVASRLLQSFGSLGVPIFFYLAGYSFRYKKLIPWLRGKVIGLLIPWFVCGTLVYFYVHVRKGGVSASSLFFWLLGEKTYLWYLPVMVLLLLWARGIFCGVQKRIWTLQVASIFSIVLSIGILELERLDVLSFHPYLNMFRWMWLFAFGLLAGKKALLEKAGDSIVLAFVWALSMAVLAALNVCIDYWVYYFPFYACLTIIVFMNSYVSDENLSKYIQKVGQDSFSIYLLHMPVAGVVANLCNRVSDYSGLLTMSRPVVVLIITHGCIILVKKLSNRFCIEQTVRVLLGLR